MVKIKLKIKSESNLPSVAKVFCNKQRKHLNTIVLEVEVLVRIKSEV
jgi:hypothetical protein